MLEEYNHSYINVNKYSCFTENKFTCINSSMSFGKRLKQARQLRGLSQAALAETVKLSQANISKLEIGNATGSEYIVQLALACGVMPEWLALGTGPMTETYSNSPERQVLIAMQSMDEQTKYQVVKISNSLAEPKANGTDK